MMKKIFFFLGLMTFSSAGFTNQANLVTNLTEVVVPQDELKTTGLARRLDVNSLYSDKGTVFSEALIYIGGKQERLKIYRDLANFLRPTPQSVERIYLSDKTIVGVALSNEYHVNGIHRLIRFSSDWQSGKQTK